MDDDPLQTEATVMHFSLGPAARMWLKQAGTILSVAGIVFVAFKLYEYQSQLGFAKLGTTSYLVIAALSVIYGASNLLLAFGWRRILLYLSVETSCRWAIWAYATSQLAKYVPGNIFQFASRQALGLAAGIRNGPLMKATILELTIVGLAGILFVPLVAPVVLPELSTSTAIILFVSIAVSSVWLAYRAGRNHLAWAAICYAIFLLLSGLIFAGAFYVGSGENWDWADLLLVSGAFVLAWLAGFATPGAPAGLGVRDAVLVFLLSGITAAPVILLSVVIGRIITVLGDFMFFLAGGAVKTSSSTA